MKTQRVVLLVSLVSLVSLVVCACRAGALVIGEDLPLDDGGGAVSEPLDAGTFADVAEPSPDGSPCEAVSGTCLEPSAQCARLDEKGRACARAGDICCLPVCAVNAAPPLGCDGAPWVKLYSPGGCTSGWACPPVTCEQAGGKCVASTACGPAFVADAASYVCATSGTVCCLP